MAKGKKLNKREKAKKDRARRFKKDTKPAFKLKLDYHLKKTTEKKGFKQKDGGKVIDNKLASKEGRVRKREREKEDGNTARKETKKERQARKMARKRRKVCGELVIELNRHIWNKKVNDMKKKEKAQFVSVVLEKVLTSKGNIPALAVKPDGSRDLQQIAINGTTEQRLRLAKATAKKASSLSKNKFGAYLIQKILDHGNEEIFDLIRQGIWNDIFHLSKNRISAKIVDTVFRVSKAQNRARMLQLFYSREFVTMPALNNDGSPMNLDEVTRDPMRDRVNMINHVWEYLTRVVAKGFSSFHFFHALLNEYLKNCTVRYLEIFTAQAIEHAIIRELVQSEPGVDAAIRILEGCGAKHRKKIISEVKDHVVDMAKDKNTYYFIVRLFDVVDDTQRLKKQLLAPLLADKDCAKLLTHSHAKFVFLSILSPRDPSIFGEKYLQKLPEPISVAYLKEQEKKEKANQEKEAQKNAPSKETPSEAKTEDKGGSPSEGNTESQAETPSEEKTKGGGKTPSDEKTKDLGEKPIKEEPDQVDKTKDKEQQQTKAVCKKPSHKRREELLQGLLKGVDKGCAGGLLEVLTMNCIWMLNAYHFIIIQEVLKVCLSEKKKEYEKACEDLVITLCRAFTNKEIMDHQKGHRAFKILVKNVPELALTLAQSISSEALVTLLPLRGVYILAAMLDKPDVREVLIEKLKAPAVVSAMRENEERKGVALVKMLMEETSS